MRAMPTILPVLTTSALLHNMEFNFNTLHDLFVSDSSVKSPPTTEYTVAYAMYTQQAQ
jgi:hypothetical protein